MPEFYLFFQISHFAMPDMLIKFYDLKDSWDFITEQKECGITVRKPIGPEKHLIVDKFFDKQSQKSLLCSPFEL